MVRRGEQSAAPRRRVSGRRAARWWVPRGPAGTVRLRLTALYGAVFLIPGAALLTVGYLFVRRNLRTHHSLRAELERLGIEPTRGEDGFPPGSPTEKLSPTAANQIL